MDELHERLARLEDRVRVIEVAHLAFVAQLTENTTITRRVETLAVEANTLLEGIRTGMKVFSYIGSFMKWGTGIVAGVLTAWAAWKSFGGH
jgi:hypothetical protein